MKPSKAVIAGAAVAGLLNWVFSRACLRREHAQPCRASPSRRWLTLRRPLPKHACKGQNDCKGQGGGKNPGQKLLQRQGRLRNRRKQAAK